MPTFNIRIKNHDKINLTFLSCTRYGPCRPAASLPIVGTGRDGPIQPQTQLSVNGVQHFHEISGTPAVQFFQFRHKEETVSRILTVTKVLHPVHPAVAIIINVTRGPAISVQRIQEISTHPPFYGQIMTEHLQPITCFCQYFLFSYHMICFCIGVKGTLQSFGPPACQAFPVSNAHGTVPRPYDGNVSSSRR